jgi:Ca2+-binding EF-hand superfamily protein
MAGLRELFKSIDADGSGTITVEELKKALLNWGHKIHEVRVCVCVWGGVGGARAMGCRR